MKAKPSVLVVDDEKFVRESLVEMLSSEGYDVVAAAGADAAMRTLADGGIDVVITDLKMPRGDGQSLLESARAAVIETPIIVLTGHGNVADAVRAMKAGAFDFVQKPLDTDQLLILVERAVEYVRMRAEVTRLRASDADRQRAEVLVGSSKAIASVRSLIAQVAPTESNVLVRGESGTGKHVVAREIHRASPRARGPMVTIDCANLNDANFEVDLFGCRGAAAGGEHRSGFLREAEGGTIVFDEISALSIELQARILRLIETGEFRVVNEARTRRADVRFIALTREDTDAAIAAGRFRSDLYFRLAVFPIEVPPLRARIDDVKVLAEHFLNWNTEHGAASFRLDAAAFEVLESYEWPGNVRELKNAIDRAAILSSGRTPDAGVLRSILESGTAPRAGGTGGFNLRDNLDALEKSLILKALAQTAGRKSDAALLLGIDAKNFGYYMRKHKLYDNPPRPKF